VSLRPTPSQTVGPFFAVGTRWLTRNDIAPPGVLGERVTIEGRVLDGDGNAVPDAVLEVWQADAHGRYADRGDSRAAFTGFGRIATDGDGRFRLATIKPGPVPGPRGSRQAPHILVSVFSRGLMRRLVTRLYFPDEPANADDPVLGQVAPPRRSTLIARRRSADGLEWDIVLQGAAETVFFDLF
jgi:protocatechuate 3,4-dioxygenase alpha subunit